VKNWFEYLQAKADELAQKQRRPSRYGVPADGERAGTAGTALINSIIRPPHAGAEVQAGSPPRAPQKPPQIPHPPLPATAGPTQPEAKRDPYDQTVDRLWSALEQRESGGRQVDARGRTIRSSAGASGIAQLMPGTAYEMAKLEGDPTLADRALADDRDANRRLGRRYLREQLKAFGGDPVLGLAAYNAGPRHVREWIRAYGDPRTGEISSADWAAKIPFGETRAYVADITGRANGRPSTR
jgi:hypothetical protein